MRRTGDNRLWFDKADGKTVFGVFTDQRFYSSECVPTYDGEEDDIRSMIEILELYSEWAKANYHELRAGRSQLPLPQELRKVRLREVLDGESEA